MRGAMRVDELMSRMVAERVHGLAGLVWQRDQNSGQVDFRSADGSVALEVTSARDPKYCAVEDAVRWDQRGAFVNRRFCQRDWSVTPRRDAKINKIRDRVDAMLAAVEADGITEFNACLEQRYPRSVGAIIKDLGVEHGFVCEWSPSGRICIGLPCWDGQVDVARAIVAIQSAVQQPDNGEKLARTGASVRALFIHIHGSLPLVQAVFRYERPPQEPVVLPESITQVTAFASVGTQKLCVWHAEKGRLWRVARMELTDADVDALCACPDSGAAKFAMRYPTG